VEGFLVGTAVGDAIGLPFEGMSARRVERRLGRGGLRHRFVFGRGMISDDTEHACMTAQAWVEARGDVEEFSARLRRKLMWWIAGLPAGVGLATARACGRMWIGFGPQRSGVRSAGNGPAMRSGVLGVLAGSGDLEKLVRASTRLTHTDPRAEQGAMVVALCAREGARARIEGREVEAGAVIDAATKLVGDAELRGLVLRAMEAAQAGRSRVEVASQLGLERGVTGFINHTVPVCVYLWARYPGDYRSAVEQAVRFGGDTDTVAAIVGGMVGARCGAEGIPAEWVAGIADWPRSVAWIRRLAGRAADVGEGPGGEPLAWPLIPARNAAFLAIVLTHGLGRLLPP
jgi:ADP-ribosylglycohydrolase